MSRTRRPENRTFAPTWFGGSRAFLVAFAVTALLGCPSEGTESPDPSAPSVPSIISPQPIPDNATGVSLDASSLSATVDGGTLRIRGTARGPVPGDTRFTLTNLTRTPVGTSFSVTFDREFEVSIEGSLADTYRLEETDAYTVVTHVRFDGPTAARFVEPCFAIEANAPALLLPPLAVGIPYVVRLVASNRCASAASIVSLRAWSEGDADVESVAHPSGPVPAAAAVTLAVPVRATVPGDVSRLVVLTASDGSVSSGRLRSFTR